MGGNSPSHFSEEEEGGGITFVKGIRLSDRVINRMKRSSEVNCPHIPPPQTAAPPAVPVQPGEHLPPPPQETRATPPPVEPAPPVKPIPPSPPVKFHSLPSASVESAEQTPPPAAVSVPSPADVKSDVSPSATTFEPAAAAESAASSPPPAEPVPTSPVDSASAEALVEPVLPSVAEEDPPAVDSGTPPPPSELAAASDLDAAAPCWSEKMSVISSDVAVNETNAEELSITHLPPAEEETPAGAAGPPPAAAALPTCPESVEEELRQKIKEELLRSLEEEMKQKRQKLQQQLEEVRVQAQAEAQAAAKAQVEQQVSRMLKAEPAEERAESNEEEKMKTEDVTLMVQLYWMELKAQQLEEKEKQMMERDVLYKEHAAKREAKFSEFCKVSAENFQRGREETQRRFARLNTQPVCGHLQAQVLKCYKENPGKTLTCSGIASAYMQCVDNAKKVHIKT